MITDLFPNSTFARKIELIVRRLFLPDDPELVTSKVRNWSRRKERLIHRRLDQWDLARPASIAILWLLTMMGLFLVTTSAAFDTLGTGPLYNTLMWSAGLTSGVAGLLALTNSFKIVTRTAACNFRFSRNTPLQRLYMIKVVMNGTLLLAMSCLILVGIVLPLLSGVNAAREAARRAQCVNNLKQIGLAPANYQSAHECFPAAFMPDKDGKPMHSWRVAILPFMEHSLVFNAYNFHVPWNDPANATVGKARISTYLCPSDTGQNPLAPSYVMVKGPGALFKRGKRLNLRLPEITDGLSNTIAVVETANADFLWTEPRDLSIDTMSLKINDPTRPSISSHHPGGANVLFFDGTVRFLKNTLRADVLRALL